VPEVRIQFHQTVGAGFLHETNAWDFSDDPSNSPPADEDMADPSISNCPSQVPRFSREIDRLGKVVRSPLAST
jgi:hypothetical protein